MLLFSPFPFKLFFFPLLFPLPVVPTVQHGNDFQVQAQARVAEWDQIYPEQEYIFGNFSERLWAYLTLQQLLVARSALLNPLDPFGSSSFIYLHSLLLQMIFNLTGENLTY